MITLARQTSHKYPRTVNDILRDFYIDDFIMGSKTEENIFNCTKKYLLSSVKLPLQKWCRWVWSSIVLEHIGKDIRYPLFTLEIGDKEMV